MTRICQTVLAYGDDNLKTGALNVIREVIEPWKRDLSACTGGVDTVYTCLFLNFCCMQIIKDLNLSSKITLDTFSSLFLGLCALISNVHSVCFHALGLAIVIILGYINYANLRRNDFISNIASETLCALNKQMMSISLFGK